MAEAFAERIRREWPADRAYGPIVSGVGLEAGWPLVTALQGGAVEVPVVEADSSIDAVLPALVASRVTRVVARNVGTGAETGELRQAGGAELRGMLPLAPDANEIELAVESDRGVAALYRFRVYSAPGALERALAELRTGNRALEVRAGELRDAARAAQQEAQRRALEIRADEAPPAAPAR